MPDIPIRVTLEGEEAVARGLGSIGTAAEGLNNKLKTSGDQAQAKFGAISEAGGTIRNVGLGIGAAGAALGYLGSQAVKAAANQQTQLKTIEAFTGSAERANEVFASLNERSTKSVFNLTELVSAGKMLEGARLKAEDYIGTADDLAAANKESGATAVDTARVLARIKAGDFGEAFERLRDFGISRQDLEGKGLTFSGGGQFEGTSDQALAAIKAITAERFGGLSQTLATETTEGSLSNLQDAFTRVAATIGAQLLPAVNAVTQSITGVLSWFNSLPEPMQKLIAYGGALAAGFLLIGGSILAVVGAAASAIVPIMTLAGAGGLAGLGAAAVAFLGPLAMAVAGVAAIGYVLYQAGATVMDVAKAFFQFTGIAGLVAAAMYTLYSAVKWFLDLLPGGGKTPKPEKTAPTTGGAARNLADGAARLAATASPDMAKVLSMLTGAGQTPSPLAGMAGVNPQQNKTYTITDNKPGMINGAAKQGAAEVAVLEGKITEARTRIEGLQDQVRATKDKGAKAILQEELRMAQRDLQHLNRARTAAAKDERLAAKIASEAAKVSELRARVAEAQASARSDVERAGMGMEGEIRDAQAKADMDAAIKDIEGQQKAGLIGRTEAQSRIEELRAAYERRDRAEDATDKMRIAQVEAQSIMAEARIKASAQKGEEKKTTLALGKIQADKVLALAQLEQDKAARLNAIQTNRAPELTPAQRQMQYLSRMGSMSVNDLPTRTSDGEVGQRGAGGYQVGQPMQSVNAQGQTVVQFPPLVIADPWAVAARPY